MKKYIVIIFFALFCICSFLGGVHFDNFINDWDLLILTFGLLGFYLCLLENKITKELFLLFFLIILVPLIFFSGLSLIDNTLVSSINDWIGFLGAYLGVIGTIAVVWWQLNEDKKAEEIKRIEKETYAVITFLLLYRESCENYSYMLNTNNIDFKIKNGLFYKAIQDTEIVMRNYCIELLFFFDKFSDRNKVMSENFDNYIQMLIELFDTLSEKADTILTNYEIIKKADNNYLENIYYNHLDNDLNSLFTDAKDIIKKYEKQKY